MGDDQDDGIPDWLKIIRQNDKIERLKKELLEANKRAESAQEYAEYQARWPDRFIKYMRGWFLVVFVICIISFVVVFVLNYIEKFIRYLF